MQLIGKNIGQTLKFSVDLLANLKSTFQYGKPATVPKLKEKIWMQYMEIRAKKLPVLWNMFLSSISCPHLTGEPLLTELINEQIMEGLLADILKNLYISKTLKHQL